MAKPNFPSIIYHFPFFLKFNGKWKMANGQSAFTLIEIMVVFGIVALVFAGGLTNFRDFDRRQQLSQAASTLRKDLDLARTKAFASEKPAGCTTSLVSWNVTFTASSYSLVADCNINDVTFKTVNLPSGITSSGLTDVRFSVLARGINDEADSTVTLTQAGTGSTTTVTVARSGIIY